MRVSGLLLRSNTFNFSAKLLMKLLNFISLVLCTDLITADDLGNEEAFVVRRLFTMKAKYSVLQGSHHTGLFLVTSLDHVLAYVGVNFVDDGDEKIEHEDDVEDGANYEQKEIYFSVFIDIHILKFSKGNKE